MKNEFNSLIEKAIQLELSLAELYLQFHMLFPSDASFWWKLTIEEKNHAALLKTLQEMNDSHVDMPVEFYPEGSEALDESTRRISKAIQDFKKNPDRKLAFRTAYDFENSAGEIHYDSFAKLASSSPLATIFKKLNGSDINHAQRIMEYMNGLDMS
ncbi:MAG: rubrerythrin family protein [Bacteroidota bacterium]